MVDRHAEDLFSMVETVMEGRDSDTRIDRGREAARRVLELMHTTQQRIPPRALCDAYIAAGGGASARVIDLLWSQFKEPTAACMADGAQLLAALWESAWAVGRREQGTQSPDAIDQERLATLYREPDFLVSLDLDHIETVLKECPLD